MLLALQLSKAEDTEPQLGAAWLQRSFELLHSPASHLPPRSPEPRFHFACATHGSP